MKANFLPVIFTLITLVCFSFLTGCSLLPTKPQEQPTVYYGKASYYGDKHHGKLTANGEIWRCHHIIDKVLGMPAAQKMSTDDPSSLLP